MKAQYTPKSLKRWFVSGSVWSSWKVPDIVYSEVKEQDASGLPSPSAYHDEEHDTKAGSLLTYKKRRSRVSLFVIIILTIIATTESIILLMRRSNFDAYISPIPEFPLHRTKFEQQSDWEFSPLSHELWAGVLPTSGLITIEHPERYNLKHGLETSAEHAEVYGVQVTHEFHCLRMIKKSFYGLVTRDQEYMGDLYAANSSVNLPQGNLSHVFHCLDYLRQTILCRSDLTIEWRSEANHLHIDGYGSPRMCRNWNEVSGWMLANLPPDAVFHQPQ